MPRRHGRIDGFGPAELGRAFLRLRLRGFPAWLAWLGVHLLYLPGTHVRAKAMVDWLHAGLTGERNERLILDPVARNRVSADGRGRSRCGARARS